MGKILTLALALAVAGCASDRWDGSDLVPGQATAADVEKTMGKVTERRSGPDGSTVLWFSRLPYGRVSYAATIGKDGKLVSVEQRLTKANLEKIRPGWREDDVRDLLGPPQRVDKFPGRDGDTWTYQAQGIEPQLIVTEFSKDGVVSKAYAMNDPEQQSRDSGGR